MKPLSFLLAGLVLPFSLHAAIYDWKDKPKDGNEMEFRLYVPDQLKKVRAVIVLTPGLDGDGRKMAENSQWQALADRTDCALMACFMKGSTGGSYYDPEKWSGKVFLQALTKLASESKHPEIINAPLAFWGHSAGGQFNFNFANWKPNRTIAFVANKGGYYGPTINPLTRKVPALWILGEKDTEIRVKNIREKYEDGRKSGALWALVPEPNEAHGLGRSRDIGIVFLEETINSRVDAFGKLQSAKEEDGWLGNLETGHIEKAADVKTGSRKLCWLPGVETARLWVEVIGRPTSDSASTESAE